MTHDDVLRVSEMLLDDFLLTYLVFMSTHDLCQALLGQYPYSMQTPHTNPSHSTSWFVVSLTTFTYSSARCRGQEEGKDALFRKRKVLRLVSHWSRLYKDFLKEEEHVRSFMKVAVSSNTCLSMGFNLHTIILILKCPFL